ncbi:MAG: preprotein translocase subunit YajC [Gemmatimonadaceae bacterium]|nr:preprotein translocase subunit YajC [Gemmatimonadaceae bacterium]
MHPVLFLQAAAPGPSPVGTLFMFGSIFAIFYFLVIRPQGKQRKEHETKVMGIKKGDQVVTAGGIVGEVVHIAQGQKDGQAQATMGDHITIKSAESRLVVVRSRIAAVGGEDLQA